jgi:hypothetical protein
VNWFFSLTDPTGWAAIQAVGSILAICAGFGTAYWQNSTAIELRKQDRALIDRDRTDRAEVVAFRLSGWLSEVGSRVLLRLEAYNSVRHHNPTMPPPHQIVAQWKLDVAVGIDSVMSDLHYLEKGAGDVAQLDFHVRYFEAYLDMAGSHIFHEASKQDEIYKSIGDQLTRMRALHAAAERHLAPIVDAAAAKER